MSVVPTKAQWKRWSLPSKYTAIGTALAVLTTLMAIVFHLYPRNNLSSVQVVPDLVTRYGATASRDNNIDTLRVQVPQTAAANRECASAVGVNVWCPAGEPDLSLRCTVQIRFSNLDTYFAAEVSPAAWDAIGRSAPKLLEFSPAEWLAPYIRELNEADSDIAALADLELEQLVRRRRVQPEVQRTNVLSRASAAFASHSSMFESEGRITLGVELLLENRTLLPVTVSTIRCRLPTNLQFRLRGLMPNFVSRMEPSLFKRTAHGAYEEVFAPFSMYPGESLLLFVVLRSSSDALSVAVQAVSENLNLDEDLTVLLHGLFHMGIELNGVPLKTAPTEYCSETLIQPHGLRGLRLNSPLRGSSVNP